METKTKNLYCKHFKKCKGDVYIYDLLNQVDLCLCGKCEKKLREQIASQIKIEKECGIK